GVPFTYFVTSDPALRGGYFQHDLAMGNRFPANTVAQLRELAGHELVEIGGHTRTHANLGAIDDPQRLFDEVIRSSDELAQAVGSRVERFAFPFGQHQNLNGQVFSLLSAHGFTAACSAYGGYNFAGDDVFHLQRMCCDGPAIKTKNFVAIDPYKQWAIPRYAYPSRGPTSDEAALRTGEAARE
ncbi:MAG: polysaccharide deacetylase family protein, partial [Pirellulales bacterium]